MEKKWGIFVVEKAAVFKYFGLHLDLNNVFGLWLELDWVFKNQDWIWIAKYDSPLISDVRHSTKANFQINAGIYSPETELKVAKRFKTRLSNPNPVKQNL